MLDYQTFTFKVRLTYPQWYWVSNKNGNKVELNKYD